MIIYIHDVDAILYRPLILNGAFPMPIAFSLAAPAPAFAMGIAGPPTLAPSLTQVSQVRKEFPENWIFYNAEKYDGPKSFSLGATIMFHVLGYI